MKRKNNLRNLTRGYLKNTLLLINEPSKFPTPFPHPGERRNRGTPPKPPPEDIILWTPFLR
jgi:hypothetical protein